ncbi:hypothetical protein GGS20DRAFT_247511 [Poronia punctata]|nr:hypothetical protein GGS20DRAFT_247511 [Poronia punctata]
MQLREILVFSGLAVATASPLSRRCGPAGILPDQLQPTPSAVSFTYVLPSTGGPIPLPAANSTLQHIAVGHGVQNYTCSTAGTKAGATGALAVLYEVTRLYPRSGPQSLSQESWDELTSKVLRTTSQPIGSDSEESASPFPPPEDLTVEGVRRPIPYLGHHFFDDAGVATFELRDDQGLFKGAKVMNISAPATADQGLNDEGAVDWLYLGDKGSSVGLSKVYRVLTSGGNPAVCGDVGETQSVPYTAMYWIY